MKRAITFTVVGVAFVALFLTLFARAAVSLPWRPLVLAVGGLAAIVVLLVLAIWLQERADAKAAAANLARCRRVEADDRQRQRWAKELTR